MKHILNYKTFSINEKVTSDKITHIAQNMSSVKNKNLPNETKAFLDTISFAEGTYDIKDKYDGGYQILFGHSRFDSYNDHPRKIIKKSGISSSAAGRYQFLSKTWDYIMKGEKFNPINQDIATVKLIKSKGVYNDIINGNVKKAFKKLAKTWASFPYSPYGQGSWYAHGDEKKMDILKQVYNIRYNKYNGTNKSKSDYKKLFDVNPFIKIGDKNSDVKTLQKSAIELGYELPKHGIDGKMGSETMNVVKTIAKNELGKNISNITKKIFSDIVGLTKDKNTKNV